MARQSFTAAHIELRHKVYYAVLYVPKSVQHIIGKTKFSRSTKTGDRHKAESIAAGFVLAWKTQIKRAQSDTKDPLIDEALDLLYQRKKSKAPTYLINEVIENRVFELSKHFNADVGEDFNAIATGEKTPFTKFIPDWRLHQEKKGLAQKTLDQQEKDIKILTKTFFWVEKIDSIHADEWIKLIAEQDSLTPSSVTRIIGSCKSFYKYLQLFRIISQSEPNPFTVPEIYRRSRRGSQTLNSRIQSWSPFEAEDVSALYKEALNRNDQELANLIKIAAYTGARLEEICSLKVENFNKRNNSINFVDTKTEAGNRTIPAHSKIVDLLYKLATDSQDGYILSNLTFNKYGDRSNAIGKRFGRIKSAIGFSNRYVFHSIRKTFTTMLDNSGINENHTADILGHEKPRITYGLYSGGASLKVKREAIEKISYGFE